MKLGEFGGWNDAPSMYDLHAEEEKKSSTMELIFGESEVTTRA
jgi:hypothetical protein